MASTDHRLSVRVQAETLKTIKDHQDQMEWLTGARWTMTQAVESLIVTGFLTWQSTIKVGGHSPSALLARGAEVFEKEKK